ncbi:MAG TPA: tetratricopeptide repeat protein [Thermoanaerobaculia bacterium]|nr:tetratricopeptide repeat protein [Thermoanaerobaculia bacterium]
MHKTLTLPAVAVALLVVPTLAGCGKLQARVELKKGNELYHNEAYTQALKQFQRGLQLDPDATFAWRSVGLTALALYRPGDETPKNIGYGKTATEAFEKYLADYPDDKKLREYLLSTYVNSKRYDDALAYLDKRLQEAPEEAGDIQKLKVNILTQQGRLDDAWRLVQQTPGGAKAEALYSIGVAAWGKSYNDATIDMPTRQRYVDLGLQALDQALKLKPDYFEAMVYTNLLYREKAKMESDANLKADFTAKANDWQQKALALRKKVAAAKPAETPPKS